VNGLNLYIWSGYVDDYYYVFSAVLAESLDSAIAAALAAGKDEESSFAEADTLWTPERVDRWMREHVQVIPTDRPFAIWGERWA
jgi:hypothetical protein